MSESIHIERRLAAGMKLTGVRYNVTNDVVVTFSNPTVTGGDTIGANLSKDKIQTLIQDLGLLINQSVTFTDI